jgi:hypothetical protein
MVTGVQMAQLPLPGSPPRIGAGFWYRLVPKFGANQLIMGTQNRNDPHPMQKFGLLGMLKNSA